MRKTISLKKVVKNIFNNIKTNISISKITKQ